MWRHLLIWTSSFLCAVVQTGALWWVQVCLHGSDQELPGRVRGGEEDQPRRRGGCNESVGEGSNGKHSLAQFINQLFIWVFKSKTYSLQFVAQNWSQTVWLELEWTHIWTCYVFLLQEDLGLPESTYELCYNATCSLIGQGKLTEALNKLQQAEGQFIFSLCYQAGVWCIFKMM